MSKAKFSKPPLTDEEKEKKLEAFINLSEGSAEHKEEQKKTRPKKEKVKPLYLRVPESLWEDIHEIMALTGLSMNAICLELLRPEIKQKLKDLKED
jgi:predicted HicB family RNase H-like nuclease